MRMIPKERPREQGDLTLGFTPTATAASVPAIPDSLVLTPVSRRPLTLPPETCQTIAALSFAESDVPRPADPRSKRRIETTVVIVTFNGMVFTRLCLMSVLRNTGAEDLEVIVVDNHSEDGTVDYLRALEERDPRVRVVCNPVNRGFSAANNQGLSLAGGDVLILLNNDTIVPRGWLRGLTGHLEDKDIGLIGPVTNRIGNEAEIATEYRTYSEMEDFAAAYTAEHRGEYWDIPTLCMYCLAMRRDVYERLGPLDERFEVGMLEDDDYSMRAHRGGLRVVCAEDAFVHHFGGASFDSLIPTGEYGRLIEANRRRYEEKWGCPWQPYRRRRSNSYIATLDRIYAIAGNVIPAGATVLVVSRGDDELLKLDGCCAQHFPQEDNGVYAGSYPANSSDAISHLDQLRRQGAGYLLFPATAFWWLDHYVELTRWLGARGQRIWTDPSCIIFKL